MHVLSKLIASVAIGVLVGVTAVPVDPLAIDARDANPNPGQPIPSGVPGPIAHGGGLIFDPKIRLPFNDNGPIPV